MILNPHIMKQCHLFYKVLLISVRYKKLESFNIFIEKLMLLPREFKKTIRLEPEQ